MKCAVAIVLALIGIVVANPVGPYGLGIASPLLVPSPVSIASSGIINHGYSGKVLAPIFQSPIIPVLKTVPLIKTPVISVPLSVGSPGYLGGYGLGLAKGVGLGYGGLGYGGLGYGGLDYGGLGYGLGYGGLGYGIKG